MPKSLLAIVRPLETVLLYDKSCITNGKKLFVVVLVFSYENIVPIIEGNEESFKVPRSACVSL
jgi:hypothetical protein